MGAFFGSLIFVLSLISLTLALATVSKSKANADTSTKLHIFLVQAVVVLSFIVLVVSGYWTLKHSMMKEPRMGSTSQPAAHVARRR